MERMERMELLLSSLALGLEKACRSLYLTALLVRHLLVSSFTCQTLVSISSVLFELQV